MLGVCFASFWHPSGSHVRSFRHPFAPFWHPKSSLGVPREGSEKQGGKKAPPQESALQIVPKWDPEVARLAVFLMIFSNAVPNHVWYEF